MKKYLALPVLLFAAVFIKAQTVNDSVALGAQYANQVWYSLANDEKGTAPKNNWDIAFEINGIYSSILLNSVGGDELWVYPNGDTAAWGTIDTAGIGAWPKLYNSDTSWSVGAFNVNVDIGNQYDLGWGVYNLNTHFITGDSLYVIKLADGSYRKLWIKQLANSVYTFRYAGLDNSGDATKNVTKSNFQGKNFAYFSFQSGNTLDREPASVDWDLVFTQYTTFIPVAYPVAGVLSNKGVEVAKAYPIANTSTYVNYGAHTLATAMNTIGYDWKTFNNNTFQYDIADSLVFFVQAKNNDVWKVIFTGFSGGSAGKFYFSKENLTGGPVGINNPAQNGFVALYPNPAAGAVSLVLDAPAATEGVITITDLTGKTVITQNIDVAGGLATYALHTGGLENGIYTVQVAAGNSRFTQKLVVNN